MFSTFSSCPIFLDHLNDFKAQLNIEDEYYKFGLSLGIGIIKTASTSALKLLDDVTDGDSSFSVYRNERIKCYSAYAPIMLNYKIDDDFPVAINIGLAFNYNFSYVYRNYFIQYTDKCKDALNAFTTDFISGAGLRFIDEGIDVKIQFRYGLSDLFNKNYTLFFNDEEVKPFYNKSSRRMIIGLVVGYTF